jgi:hypothetical protein
VADAGPSSDATQPSNDAAQPSSDAAPEDASVADGAVDASPSDAGMPKDASSDATAACGDGGCPTTGVILYGGFEGATFARETWWFDGATWAQLDTHGPAPHSSYKMATWGPGPFLFSEYSEPTDSGAEPWRNESWTFGAAGWKEKTPLPASANVSGVSASASLGTLGNKVVLLLQSENAEAGWEVTTWTSDGTSWTNLHIPCPSDLIVTSPMVELGGKLVLFGFTGAAETWTFDGSSWTQLDIPAPPPRNGEMARLGNEIVLFGGYNDVTPGTWYGDTWTFDGAKWTQLNIPGPPARAWHGLATLGNEVVLFGGQGTGGTLLDDTWTFDGAKWTQVNVAGPPTRSFFAMTGM